VSFGAGGVWPRPLRSRGARRATPARCRRTPLGEISLLPDPAGTRGGWDDLRRRATREPLGGGVRAPIAAIEDLIRIAASAEPGRSDVEIETLRRVAERARARGVSR
jgi:hypothetical protein